MNNKTGVIVGVLCSAWCSLIYFGSDSSGIVLAGGILGVMALSYFIAIPISFFSKFKNLGKLFGIISALLLIIFIVQYVS